MSNFYFFLFKFNQNCLLNRSTSNNSIVNNRISKFFFYSLRGEEFGFYLAVLLEGDGHISIPAIGKTTLNKIFNPRFVFTFHLNNIELYKNIQLELDGIGRFENKGENTCRYIIGKIEGIKNW